MDFERQKKEDAPSKTEIILAQGNHAYDIQELLYQTWRATYPNQRLGLTVEDIDDRFKDRFSPERLDRLTNLLEHPEEGVARLVALREGKVVGTIFVKREEDRNELMVLYVLPEYQGTGVGTSLWNDAQQFLDAEKDTYLTVVSYNDKAMAFYKSLGFSETGNPVDQEKFRFANGVTLPRIELVRHAA